MSTPNTQPTAYDVIQQALAAGISPEALIAAAQESMRTITPMTVSTGTQAKEVATPLVRFAEAAKRLKKEANFDLEQAREQTAQTHDRWGIVDAIKDKGLIRSLDDYRTLLGQATMSEAGLTQLIADLNAGKNMLPVLNANMLDEQELFKILVEQSGIPFWKDSYGYQNLGNVRIVNPSDIPNLANLNRNTPYEKHLAAFKAAYDKTPKAPTKQPELTFTLDTKEVQQTNVSATESAHSALANGTKYASPANDFLRWKQQLDRGLQTVTGIDPQAMDKDQYQKELAKSFKKPMLGSAPIDAEIPDRQKVTQYPLAVLPDGDVLGLSWRPGARRVDVDRWYPRSAYGYVGRRSVLA